MSMCMDFSVPSDETDRTFDAVERVIKLLLSYQTRAQAHRLAAMAYC